MRPANAFDRLIERGILLEAKILVERQEAVAPRDSVMRFVETPDLLIETSRGQPDGVHKQRQ
jgi:hypothetical protein